MISVKKTMLLIIFLVSACVNPKPQVLPEESHLPDGFVEQEYLTEISITNAILFKENVGVDFTPSDSGLKWQPRVLRTKRGGAEIDEEDYHYIIISGKAKSVGDIFLHISGFSMGTMHAGKDFSKTYIIKIKQ